MRSAVSILAVTLLVGAAVAVAGCGDDGSAPTSSASGTSSGTGMGGAGGAGGSTTSAGGGTAGSGGAGTGGGGTGAGGPMLPCPSDTGDCDGDPSNGCETPVLADESNCGGCGNACPAGYVCNGSHCICGDDAACGPGGVCTTGACICGDAGFVCTLGQTCVPNMPECSCNGGPACPAGETCCNTPSGCIDLTSDTANCGGCNHACAPGFGCQTGACICDDDADCNAGTAGNCVTSGGSAGRCKCGNVTCAYGERCQADGNCG